MKRYVVSKIMIVAMLLFGASHSIEASFVVKEFSEAMANSLLKKGMNAAAIKSVAKELAEAGVKNLDDVGRGMLKQFDNFATKGTQALIDPQFVKNFTGELTSNLKHLKSVGADIGQFGADDIAGLGSRNVQELTGTVQNLVNTGKISQLQASTIISKSRNAAGALAGVGDNILGKAGAEGAEAVVKNVDEVIEAGAETFAKQGDTAAGAVGKNVDGVVDNTVHNPLHSATNKASSEAAQEGSEALLKNVDSVADDVIDDAAGDAIAVARREAQELAEKARLNKIDGLDDLAGKIKADETLWTRLKKGLGYEDAAKKRNANIDDLVDKARFSSTRVERYTAAKQLRQMSDNPIFKVGRSLKRFVKSYGMYVVAALGGATLMMAPGLIQQSYIAKQNKNAMIETYLPPVKFGNIVMQLPDSVIDVYNPMMSQFVYYGIPVNNPGEELSAAARAAYPGVSGPTSNNKLSTHIQNESAELFSVGTAKKPAVARYDLDASALETLPIYVMYSDSVFIPWSSAGIPDPTFTQMMVNLNTGGVLYADGTSQGAKPVDLIGPKSEYQMHTIQSFLAYKLGALNVTGTQAQFTEYEQTFSSVKASKVNRSIANQFDCSCLIKTNNGILSSDATKACDAGNSCLLTRTLDQLAAGLVLNAEGKVLTPDQSLTEELAKGALGQIIPIQGFGDKFSDILQMFPGAEQNSLASMGALTVSLGADMSDASSVKMQGADPDNYTAKGVYVYQCKNTPLAKILKSQAGGSATYASQITDYIVFLDADLNQVPLMAPVADEKNYNFLTMGLNPKIKHFSTIIGDIDANGLFTFLPQLDIQSPAEYVAKGIPKTFSPLYDLRAKNGSLMINYNRNLSMVISNIMQEFLSNYKLAEQFNIMKSSMMGLLANGPFGKYALTPVSQDMQPVIGGVNLPVYTGFNSYPASQDQADVACTDVLIPISDQGRTVTLPSNNVAQYYGLVTDLNYVVLEDGSLAVGKILPETSTTPSTISWEEGFVNSAFDPATWSINTAKAGQYYWLDRLTAMGKSSDPAFVMPPSLVSFVKQARAAWIAWVRSAAVSGLTKSEFTGITIPGTKTMLTSASQQALSNGLYLYTCSPSPSVLQDYFVLTNNAAPQASDSKFGTMSATTATSSTNMLSVISGILYNSSGTPVKNAAGATYSVDPATVLKTLNATFPQALANDLKIKLNISSGTAAATAMAMVYPFSFGDLQLGRYQVDIDKNVYLYFDASGAGASANFQPSDYFVTIDSYINPSSMGLELDTTTQYMVSLVSGQVYGPSGIVDKVTNNVLALIINKLSAQWRAGVASQIATLTARKIAADQATAQQTAAMEDDVPLNTGGITWPKATLLNTIAALAGQNYLAEPYGLLKRDPATGVYALVTPANVEMTQFIYTFFNVQNSLQNAQGNPIQVAASYDEQGNLLRVIDGLEYVSMLHQYGVSIDSTGKQYLGASNQLPILQLDPADVALKPGMSGKSMLLSSHADFPSRDIVSPVSYNNKQYYFYYNTIMQAYYAMQVIGSDISYIDMAGGCVYNQNGSPRLQLNPVAMQSNKDATDLFLPYATSDGLIQCFMRNRANNNAYSDFYNSVSDFEPFVIDPVMNESSGLNLLFSLDEAAIAVNITQMPFPEDLQAMPDLSETKQYNVYYDGADTPISYTVAPDYQWQNLQLLPISMTTRALLNPMPADQYTTASLVMNGNAVFAMVFAGELYNNAQSVGQNSYSMTSGANKITVSMKLDAKTSTQYVEVVAGSVTYNYQCSFMTLLDAQLTDLRRTAWQLEVVADVSGNVVLEPYISIDAYGNLQLTPVSINNVLDVPTDPAAKSEFSAVLGSIQFDAGTGKYITYIEASKYPYFTQQGFVDLENGVLFDATGLLVGYTLQYRDLMRLLSSLSIAVVRDTTGKAKLSYRAPMNMASIDPTSSSLPSSYVPSALATSSGSSATPAYVPPVNYPASSTPSSSNVPTMSTSPSAGSPSATSYTPSTPSTPSYTPSAPSAPSAPSYTPPALSTSPTPSTVQTSSPAKTSSPSASTPPSASSGLSGNSAIADLQMKNQKLKADLSARQKSLAAEKVAHRREVIQKAIKVINDQIKANNDQIVLLQISNSARSGVLGRLTSKVKQKRSKSSVKTKKAMKGITL